MVFSAVYFLDTKGKIIIFRDYRGDIPRSFADKFSLKIQESNPDELKPVFTEDGVTSMYIKYKNVYMLAMTRKNANVTIALLFMYKIMEILKAYVGSVEEESIRDNFVLVYELLDEVCDFGYPQLSEVKVLKEFIFQRGAKLQRAVKPPAAATNVVSWRQEGIMHSKNEVFLDVVEKLNLLVSSSGSVLSSEILGSVQMRSLLSGMPELKLGLNDKALFQATGRAGKAVELEDIKFHQCVRLTKFDADRTISFIPPDGDFELMSYRLNTKVKPLLWVETVVEEHRSRVDYVIKAKSQFKQRSSANNVEILIPVPKDVDTPQFKAAVGTVAYVPALDAVKWSIKQFHGQREYVMRARFGLPSISHTDEETANWRRPINVRFEIPYFTVSGLQVRYLKIIEKSGYQALPWVRYITQNGDYQLRMT